MCSKISKLINTPKCIINCHNNKALEDKAILDICRNDYAEFLYKDNVVAIGLGFKVVKGVTTREKCLQVFVKKKIPCCCLSSDNLIPTYYEEIKTDVIESGGSFKSLAVNSTINPIIGGFSISSALNSSFTGSLGCFVQDSHTIYMLSNNHVIAGENQFPIGTPVLHSESENSKTPHNTVVATLSKFVDIRFLTPTTISENFVDAAIAEVKDPSLLSSALPLIGTPTCISEPALGKRVQMNSSASQYTIGNIISLGVTARVEFPKGKVAIFKDQIISNNNVIQGDSGTLLLDIDNNGAIGLLCAGSPLLSVVNPINYVLNNLNVTLVTN